MRSYVENGERFISIETCDQSNAERDESQPEQEDTKVVTSGDSAATTFSSSGDRCISNVQISFR